MDRIVVQDPQVLVLAAGRTRAERNQKRGALLETFVALLLEKFGFSKPRESSLNVTSNGIELDITASHLITNARLLAECKAYSRNIPAHMLDTFYGKLSAARFTSTDTFGLFVALPDLVAQGREQARLFSDNDRNFRLVTAADIFNMLLESERIVPIPRAGLPRSDEAVIITQEGIYSAVKELDRDSRTPRVVRVWAANGSVPEPVQQLVESSPYASNLSVAPLGAGLAIAALAPPPPEPTVAAVVGSTEDFEYQLPASPKFFVGRKRPLARLRRLLTESESGQVVVLNAQSGWGKSSLALRAAALAKKCGGFSEVLDTRTATNRDYVWAALRRGAIRAETAGLLSLPQEAAFGSLRSALSTLERAKWNGKGPLLIFFDQFENVFRDRQLTMEFRDLAVAVREVGAPIVVGFAWKTDLIGWTEDHPYQLRDDIRHHASVITVDPFGPSEIDTLLRRLKTALGATIHSELRRLLREHSQGLPWLFKKLASHILREIGNGSSQTRLVAESLRVQQLFESDLAELTPAETESLRQIARRAPVLVSEVVDVVPSAVVQSLLDRRLLVQVGERLDTYWDTFRDFLNTGRVPVEESYILRQTPASVGRLLRELVGAGGELGVVKAAGLLSTSETVVFNLAREARMLGIIHTAPGSMTLSDRLSKLHLETSIRETVALALRNHKAYSWLQKLLESEGGSCAITTFAEGLSTVFPAVEAKPSTWLAYARAFVHWFAYAGLAQHDPRGVTSGAAPETARVSLLVDTGRTLVRDAFPASPPGPALELLKQIRLRTPFAEGSERGRRKAIRDLRLLGAVRMTDDGRLELVDHELVDAQGKVDERLLRNRLDSMPGGAAALARIEADPAIPPADVGQIVAEAYQAKWAVETKKSAGKYYRAWARAAGIDTSLRTVDPGNRPVVIENHQLGLWRDGD
jgi:hypothetical protein